MIEFDEEILDEETSDQLVNDLKSYIIDHQGSLQVFATIESAPGESARFGREYSLAYSKELKRDLKSFPVIKNVWYA